MAASSAGDVDYGRGGQDYAAVRRADPRIEALVHRALGDARTVLNVGAGAGSYEPRDRFVVPVEPSAAMRAQRSPDRAAAVPAVAGALPFRDRAFDAALAMATVHQWPDLTAGLAEVRRVTDGPVVVLTFDPQALLGFWLAAYVPEVLEAEAGRQPALARITAGLGGGPSRAEVVPVPLDCTDGFVEAFYGRPEQLLDPAVRSAQSSWRFVARAEAERGLATLEADLVSGGWDERWGHLRDRPTYQGALRLVVSRPAASGQIAGRPA